MALQEATLPEHFALIMNNPLSGISLDMSEVPDMHVFDPFLFLRSSGNNYSLFDLGLIIERATVIHAIDSALTHYAEHLALTAVRAVIHLYPVQNHESKLPSPRQRMYQRDWEVMVAPISAQHLGLRIDHPAPHQIIFLDAGAAPGDPPHADDIDLLLTTLPWAVPPPGGCELSLRVVAGVHAAANAQSMRFHSELLLGRLVPYPPAAQPAGRCALALEPRDGGPPSAAAETDDGRCALAVAVGAAALGLPSAPHGAYTLLAQAHPPRRWLAAAAAAVPALLLPHAALPVLAAPRLAAAAAAAPPAGPRGAALAAVEREYAARCAAHSDIHEHLPVLRHLVVALGAATAAELGVVGLGGLGGSWALAAGLAASAAAGPKLWVGVDIKDHPAVGTLRAALAAAGVGSAFALGDSAGPAAAAALPAAVDVLLIDSWHVLGQLRRELAAHHGRVCGAIALHDTTIDGSPPPSYPPPPPRPHRLSGAGTGGCTHATPPHTPHSHRHQATTQATPPHTPHTPRTRHHHTHHTTTNPETVRTARSSPTPAPAPHPRPHRRRPRRFAPALSPFILRVLSRARA